MKIGVVRVSGILMVCACILAGTCSSALAGIPEGYRDIKLGMNKGEVLNVMKNSPIHFSYDDMGREIGEIVRGDNLFRYATYRFDAQGILVEIGLQMREILGRDKVLDMFNRQHGLKISPSHGTVELDRSIEVRDNGLIMKMNPNADQRSAKGETSRDLR
ncbi:MAG: hypothetical protein RDU20_03525 [Desulfomonilaceae bacterium]|nr:hypothetical protein [Desulfomonilaceae bacterium]